jgi:hypothetical protein
MMTHVSVVIIIIIIITTVVVLSHNPLVAPAVARPGDRPRYARPQDQGHDRAGGRESRAHPATQAPNGHARLPILRRAQVRRGLGSFSPPAPSSSLTHVHREQTQTLLLLPFLYCKVIIRSSTIIHCHCHHLRQPSSPRAPHPPPCLPLRIRALNEREEELKEAKAKRTQELKAVKAGKKAPEEIPDGAPPMSPDDA